MGHSDIHLVNGPFELPYDIELGDIQVVPFESFEAMCKWVADGRKLEDLQGDCRDEWVHAREMAVGSLAVVMTRNYENDDVAGKVVVRVDSGLVQALDDPRCRWPSVDKITATFSVWPLGPGDSMTISPRNP